MVGKRRLKLSDRKQTTYDRERKAKKAKKTTEKLEIKGKRIPDLCILEIPTEEPTNRDDGNTDDNDESHDYIQPQEVMKDVQLLNSLPQPNRHAICFLSILQ